MVSTGDADGAVLVKEIGLWKTAAFGEQLMDLNGTLLFVAGDQTHEVELWKSDGTEGGTVLVKDIFPGGDAGPTALTNVNGTRFFRAHVGIHGKSLWKSDGTEDGTVLVKDMPAYHLANVNVTVIFTADQQGGSLWKSDGTEDGTVLVKDMNAGSLLFNVKDTHFFHGTRRRELWKSDGTEGGTLLVKDEERSAVHGNPAARLNAGNFIWGMLVKLHAVVAITLLAGAWLIGCSSEPNSDPDEGGQLVTPAGRARGRI